MSNAITIVSAASSFPWGAIATVVAGSMAVLAAWNIGRRQNRILERQTLVAENDLKVQLFDRRSTCVSEMRRLYSAHVGAGKLTHEELRDLQRLMFDVQILFPTEIVSEFEEAFSESHQAHWKHHRSDEYFERGQDDRGKKFREEAWKHDDRVFELLPSLHERLKTETRLNVWDSVGQVN